MTKNETFDSEPLNLTGLAGLLLGLAATVTFNCIVGAFAIVISIIGLARRPKQAATVGLVLGCVPFIISIILLIKIVS